MAGNYDADFAVDAFFIGTQAISMKSGPSCGVLRATVQDMPIVQARLSAACFSLLPSCAFALLALKRHSGTAPAIDLHCFLAELYRKLRNAI